MPGSLEIPHPPGLSFASGVYGLPSTMNRSATQFVIMSPKPWAQIGKAGAGSEKGKSKQLGGESGGPDGPPRTGP